MSTSANRGIRSRWVGPPVPASLQSDGKSRYPNRRQKHYAALELVGSGEQVYVNDVVEVAEGQPSTSEQPHRFAQVGWLFIYVATSAPPIGKFFLVADIVAIAFNPS